MNRTNILLDIESYEDFWRYCKVCPQFRIGCAVSCELRKHLKIPPHGSQYRFQGTTFGRSTE
jgi:hypothetical protein